MHITIKYNVLVSVSYLHTCTAHFKASACTESDCSLPAAFSPNLLLILIFSSAVGEAKDKREAIRATWASGLTNKEGSNVHYR